MTALLLPAIAATLAGFVLAALALGAFRLRHERQRAALESLCAMKWSEFSHHVAALLGTRGLEADSLNRRPGEEGFDLRMKRGRAIYLVQCKLGAAFRVGPEAVRELGKLVDHNEAEGGILVTTGQLAPGARRQVSGRPIELLDGASLWQQLEPLLPRAVVEEIDEVAGKRLKRRRTSAAMLALLAGISVFAVLALRSEPTKPPERATATPPRPAAERPTPPASADPAPAQPDPALPAQMPDPNLDADALMARRAEAERRVADMQGVVSAAWTTQSTLAATLRPSTEPGQLDEALVAEVCAELVRFEELRYTRLQLQIDDPRDADTARVRWRQCR